MSNYELRLRARKALAPILPIALLVSLCAELPSLLAQVAGTLTEQPLMQVLYAYLESDPALYAPEKLLANVAGAISPAMLAAWAGTVLAFVLTPFLSLGRIRFSLKLLRGEEASLIDVLSCAGLFLKALALNLLIVLKELTWALPGIAVMLAGMGIFLASPSAAMLNVMTGLYFGGFVLAIVLMFRAALHYMLAEYVMADHPDVGVRAAIRCSVRIMRSRKLLLLTLMVFFFGLLILCSIGQSLIQPISPIIATTLAMAVQLAISVYMQTSITAFYMVYQSEAE